MDGTSEQQLLPAALSKELGEDWNRQVRQWAEELADREDFSLQATPIKPARLCRQAFIASITEQVSFERWGGIPLRGFLLIDQEIDRVAPSKEAAELVRAQMRQGQQKFLEQVEGERPPLIGKHPPPLEEVMGFTPKTMELLYELVTRLLAEKRLKAYGDLILFLAQINPYVACYQVGCGIFYEMGEELEEACFYYRQARELNPGNPHGYLYGAYCALKLQKKAEAEQLLEELQLICGNEGDRELEQLQQQGLQLLSELTA